jgi:inward rectifier potassium channel
VTSPTRSGLETQIFSTASSHTGTDAASESESQDLGFDNIAAFHQRRLLNRDGSFNVRREGYSPLSSHSLYHYALSLSWTSFYLHIGALYLVLNFIFGIFYFLCGADDFTGSMAVTPIERFLDCFFFSVQTFATIGYGRINPVSIIANLLVTEEVLVGLLSFALATGLLFARFSRPNAKIRFSDKSIIAPHRDATAFEFRIVNERANQLIDLSARLVMSRLELESGGVRRKFYDLPLERSQVMFFPLHWTIVHYIDEDSPLHGITTEKLAASDAEFLVLLTGLDDTFSQTVHTWSSYKPSEIVWGAKFSNILEDQKNGSVKIDMNRISDIETV